MKMKNKIKSTINDLGNHETWENLVEDSRTDDIIQHGLHMVD